jgi:hypothetical protein
MPVLTAKTVSQPPAKNENGNRCGKRPPNRQQEIGQQA